MGQRIRRRRAGWSGKALYGIRGPWSPLNEARADCPYVRRRG